MRILVVDDTPADRLLLKELLEWELDAQVITAESGMECMQYLKRSTPDLILMDVNMPGPSGFEWLKIIRKDYTSLELPVIMVTACGEDADIVDGLQLGANDYVVKPINFSVTIARLRNVLNIKSKTDKLQNTPAKTKQEPFTQVPQMVSGELFQNTLYPKRYRYIDSIGRGGVAEVFLVEDLLLKRFVAMKLLDPYLAVSRETREGFIHEVQIAAQFNYKHIVLIHEVVELTLEQAATTLDFPERAFKYHTQNLIFFTMQYIEGQNLAEYILAMHASDDSGELYYILFQIALALEHSHEKGVVHRDVKPHNIMLNKDCQVVVTDFGTARFGDIPRPNTNKGGCTPIYASPEQLIGDKVDEKTDIYSFGILSYELLTGRNPFSNGSHWQNFLRKVKETVEPLAQVCPSLPEETSVLVTRCLSKDPKRRPLLSELIFHFRKLTPAKWLKQ